ncbi:MAG: hypothetical protein QXH27_03910 [Candidatus Micrarchaeia archaeon]
MREKLIGAANSLSGSLGFVGSAHDVCHASCTAAIALLSVAGVSVSGMPLLFLQDYALLFWSMGVAFLAFSVWLARSGFHAPSPKLLTANAGILIAGVPFGFVDVVRPFLWILGGTMVTAAAAWFLHERFFA